ncbi:MAG: hypothetical protein Q7U35_02890 [Methanobacteriaceae archaeon]|nr:hypothetical protein [Methanobacteriaceae archaeon]MDP2835948.1 hypothetical protein [Methanobacteriaceae archaeon]MDP3035281.1 hypothetical protein [Methanobacteriaceae archaeon]MDP3484823.1 hypothetical protein [Methanobacteriaceae archaeon]MDP3623114.1 hypothetical protein [Methanobacteriaceae archaeon]
MVKDSLEEIIKEGISVKINAADVIYNQLKNRARKKGILDYSYMVCHRSIYAS